MYPLCDPVSHTSFHRYTSESDGAIYLFSFCSTVLQCRRDHKSVSRPMDLENRLSGFVDHQRLGKIDRLTDRSRYR